MTETIKFRDLMVSQFAHELKQRMARVESFDADELKRQLAVAVTALHNIDCTGDCHCVGVARDTLKEIQ